MDLRYKPSPCLPWCRPPALNGVQNMFQVHFVDEVRKDLARRGGVSVYSDFHINPIFSAQSTD